MMMMNNCINGSESLPSCNHSNNIIKIKKIRVGGGKDINHYSLSLRYSQNDWWEQPNEIKWIECKHLCKICTSLPGIGETGESVSQLTVYMILTMHVIILQIVIIVLDVNEK